MQFLYWLEKIRNPVFDFIFSAITHLGDETAFLTVAILIFWCINKRHGYFVLTSGLFGTVLNQAMKLLCKIPRPFVRDTSFTIVESAREGAGGYSFPSGHSQNAASTFGAIFLTTKKLWLKITCGVIAGLVMFSRMYLGVHTPWDVIAGASSAIVILLLLEDVFKKEELFNKVMPFFVGGLFLLTVGYFVYAMFFVELPAETLNNYDAVLSGKKNACTLLGCSIGLILVYVLDRFVIKFDTKAPWYAQIIKLAVGLAVVLLIQNLLRSPFESLMGVYGRIPRYFLMVAFAGAVWPLTFKYFAKMRIPALDRLGRKVAATRFGKLFVGDEYTEREELPAASKTEEVPTYFGKNSILKKNKKKR
ncbi:MAG: phosphatase PAP2 family protein [Clostridia bacterium]|nr:phosphatase PAP2 family protein [Clostridia bacterium]